MYKTILDRILQTKKEELEHFRMPEPIPAIERRSLKKALARPHHALGLIAEIKQASPSKGLFREKINAAAIAEAYEDGGADAISVLTDRTYFHGSAGNLIKVKKSVGLPVLRKDFIIEERQIEEAFRIGADAVLLIAAALDPDQLHELYLAAQERGLESLVEVHRAEEAEAVLSKFTPEIIGVNNRNLKTFETKLEVTAELERIIPGNALLVSESGVQSAADVMYLKNHGADAALVGEALIRAHSPKDKVRALFGEEVNAHAPRA